MYNVKLDQLVHQDTYNTFLMDIHVCLCSPYTQRKCHEQFLVFGSHIMLTKLIASLIRIYNNIELFAPVFLLLFAFCFLLFYFKTHSSKRINQNENIRKTTINIT